MQATHIGWTDFSSNPIKYRDKAGRIVWACVRHSPGCTNCYAQTLAMRWNKGKEFTATNIEGITPFLDTKEIGEILNPKKLPSGKRVFIEDMSDLFGAWVPDAMIDTVFAAMALRPDVTFQVLTKRADRMAEYLTDKCRMAQIHCVQPLLSHRMPCQFPLKNVMVGFSAENQEWFNKRWPHVEPLALVGWKTWVSAEPLLGPIGVLQAMPVGDGRGSLSWGVIGGESGSGRRSCEVEAITNLVEQFEHSEVPIFVKQDSHQYPGKQGRIPLDVWNVKQHPASKAVPA